MVEPDQVHAFGRGRHPGNPPGEFLAGVGLPAIDWVTPELAGRTEVVGRDARDEERFPLGIELEQVGARPDIRAVQRDEDRHVADQLDLPLPARLAKRPPLPREDELDELVIEDRLGQRLAASGEGLRLAHDELTLP
jgi:hypothetical protein